MNNNIEEDYVSFETAKLLHDKGFESEDCIFYYVKDGILCCVTNLHWYYGTPNIIEAPTLQMAMKWLREVHHLHIWFDNDASKGLPWYYEIHNTTKTNGKVEHIGNMWYGSYETACDAAIQYCLKNLI